MIRNFKDRINEVEGEEFPSKTYRKMVLQPAYDEAKKYFLHSMIQIHTAHLKMLEEQGIVSPEDAIDDWQSNTCAGCGLLQYGPLQSVV